MAALSEGHPGGLRVGQGFDVHAFAEAGDAAKSLRLGGVDIPGGPPLAGHSDGDVVLHALTDALLGAVAAGDLGTLVGVDRPETAGADSVTFVAQACRVLQDEGWWPGNVDLTVIAQRPRLAEHRGSMRHRVAALLGVDAGAVSVKATTTDHLGMIGRGEGIACLAVVVVHRQDA